MDTSGIKSPSGGFAQGGWYWNPSIGQAQRYWNGSFLAPGQTEPAGPAPVAQQSNPVAELIKSSIDATTKQYDEFYKKQKSFDQANPFNPDQWLTEERSKATQELDPYYKQTLGDYLQGVETKRTRSLDDQRTLLNTLNADTDYYTGRAKINLDNALEKSRNGFADAGLYSSGAALRNQGQITEASNSDTQNYTRKVGEQTNDINTNTSRTLQDLTTNSGQYQRDLNQEKSYNIENTALSSLKQREGQYSFERGQATGAPPGVNPQQYDTGLYNYLQ